MDRGLATELFRAETHAARDAQVISLEGELDIAGLECLRDELRGAAATDAARIVVDLRGLNFIDGGGARTVLEAARALGDRLRVYPGPPAIQRVFALAGIDSLIPFVRPPALRSVSSASELNVQFVQKLWEAFKQGGAAAMGRLAPHDVDWSPSAASGTVLHGPAELREFWASSPVDADGMRVLEFRSVGEDVLVRSEVSRADGGARTVWSLYQFSEATLIRAQAFDTEQEALSHAA